MKRLLQYVLLAIIGAFLIVAFVMLAIGTGWFDLAKAVISIGVAAALAVYGLKRNLLPE